MSTVLRTDITYTHGTIKPRHSVLLAPGAHLGENQPQFTCFGNRLLSGDIAKQLGLAPVHMGLDGSLHPSSRSKPTANLFAT